MGIAITWTDDTHTIILMSFDDVWTWPDLRAANAQVDTMIKSEAHVVDIITDLTNSRGLPSGALSEARAMMNGFESGEGLIVAVRVGTLVQSLYPVFYQLYGKRAGFPQTHFFETLDEALAYIRQQRGRADTP